MFLNNLVKLNLTLNKKILTNENMKFTNNVLLKYKTTKQKIP